MRNKSEVDRTIIMAVSRGIEPRQGLMSVNRNREIEGRAVFDHPSSVWSDAIIGRSNGNQMLLNGLAVNNCATL